MEKCKVVTIYRFKDTDEFQNFIGSIKSKCRSEYTLSNHYSVYASEEKVGGLVKGYKWPFYFEINIGEESLEKIVAEFIEGPIEHF